MSPTNRKSRTTCNETDDDPKRKKQRNNAAENSTSPSPSPSRPSYYPQQLSPSNPILEIDLNAYCNSRKNISKASPQKNSDNDEQDEQQQQQDIEIEIDDPPTIQVQGSDNLLRDMIYPLDPSIFMKDFFRQKAVHISTKGTFMHRIQDLIQEHMYSLDMESLLNDTSSDSIFVWLHSQNNPTSSTNTHNDHHNDTTNNNDTTKKQSPQTNKSTLRSIEISNPSTALSLHHVGHATYCRAPPELEQHLVSSLLRSTGFGCGQYDPSGTSTSSLGRGEVELFAGTKHHFTNWHFDFQENFTMQVSGIKRWRLKQGCVRFPMRGCTPHYYYSCQRNSHDSSSHTNNNNEDRKRNHSMVESQLKSHRLSNPSFEFGRQNLPMNAHGDEVEILMYPGDVLYFPAGIWHCVETVEMGISINVSLMATTYAHIVCEALQHMLLQRDPWRETIVNDTHATTNTAGDGRGELVLSKTRALLKELPTIIQEFTQNGGEQALFPPVLRYPPNFTSTADDAEPMEDDNDDIDIDPQEEETGSTNNDIEEDTNESKSDSGVSQEEMASTMDASEDSIVDVEDFHPPNGWSWYKHSNTDVHTLIAKARLVKNPLATLTNMTDISSFYDTIGGIQEDPDSESKQYVLNISFGGNDMQESSVRTVLKESSDYQYLEKCADCEKKGGDPAALFDFSVSGDELESNMPPLCLFYYGYFYWVDK